MRLLIWTAVFLVPVFFGKAAAQNTILWKVSHPDSEKVSYLLGTYHQMGNSFVDSVPQIKEALRESEIAIFESTDSSNKVIALLNSRKDDFSYRQHLNKNDLAFLDSFAASWPVSVHKLTPQELLVKLQQEYYKSFCGTIKPTDTFTHFDKYLIHLARKNSIRIAGLETDSLQTQYINTAGKADWRELKRPVREWIENIRKSKHTDRYCRHAHDYMAFSFNYQFNEKCGNNIMLKGRNERWMQQLPAYLQNQNSFVAVGLLHLFGDCGLIMQLRQNGYTVEPVSLKAGGAEN